MGAFRRGSTERINVFEVDQRFVFKHYFDTGKVFGRLKQYYNNHQYRFEIPPGDFTPIRSFLADHGYGLVVVDAKEEFVVVAEKYSTHPDNIFKESVMQRSVDGHNCFLLKDQDAVAEATRDHAIRLTETGLENPF